MLGITELAQVGVGFVLAAVIGFFGLRAGWLDVAGAAATTAVGALVFGFGGWLPSLLLIAFFVSSSLWSRYGARRKTSLEAISGRGQQRQAAQVVANGAIPAMLTLGWRFGADDAWLAGVIGALAAVTADTWATELGVLAAAPPRSLRHLKPVMAGTSGAISAVGLLASAAGALFIGVTAWLLTGHAHWLLPAIGGGLIGSLVDSLSGAWLQASFQCQRCGEMTESTPTHACGGRTQPVRGWALLNNDGVNLLASASGALMGWIMFGQLI